MDKELQFEIVSKLGKVIRITKEYWKVLVEIKHPSVKNKEGQIKQTIAKPDEIKRSSSDEFVFLHYKKLAKYYLCVVVKHLNGSGFVITSYLTDMIKTGEVIWKK